MRLLNLKVTPRAQRYWAIITLIQISLFWKQKSMKLIRQWIRNCSILVLSRSQVELRATNLLQKDVIRTRHAIFSWRKIASAQLDNEQRDLSKVFYSPNNSRLSNLPFCLGGGVNNVYRLLSVYVTSPSHCPIVVNCNFLRTTYHILLWENNLIKCQRIDGGIVKPLITVKKIYKDFEPYIREN